MKPGLFLLSLLLVIATAAGASAASSSRIVRIAAGHHQLMSETKPAGDLAGFEVDLATALCARAGLICKLLPDGDDTELIPALLGGKPSPSSSRPSLPLIQPQCVGLLKHGGPEKR